MPAFSSKFPWPSHYGNFNFFENKMRSHNKISSVNSIGNGIYSLKLKDGRDLRIFICECYAFGVAQYMETAEILGNLDAIIINSAWCGYSPDAKRHCRQNRVGLFMIGEFMAALNRRNFWEYLTEAEKEYFKKNGWL